MARPANKNAVRTPSGQISRASSAIERGIKPAEWARIRDDLVRQSRSQYLGSELGRLMFHERITTSEFEAGRRYAETMQKCLRVIGLRCVAPGDPAKPSGRAFPVPGSGEWDTMTKAGQEASLALYAMQGAIIPSERRAVEQVCVRGLPVDDYIQFASLKNGLATLHRFFTAPKRKPS